MKNEFIVNKVKEIVSPIIVERDADLIDIELKGKKGSRVLRVFIDTDTGISLDVCEKISQEISDILDRKDLIKGKYRLEVSSPGISRPLKTYKDFKRNLNRKVELNFLQNDKRMQNQSGVIKEVTEDTIELEIDGKRILFYLKDIEYGKVLPPW